ncbi:Excinuclease ABC subunit A [Anaerococcus prevotii]|uniref:UvrABC system protein A n=1 Tax=Anaerococcus prevotii (strain ATCC 9321 / DSM 20548 / JCM 6508 / NCTC 11806 / PC1) TaxID=525919 RepID=C7RE16_ANAPD|nr:excinuclease ABC subunit UvrA [Anaerococcus prevotii]ACV29429.1 excinuclease ABC, A subunit [Anaerococcus prevotii DSM 20548]SUU95101.1 Excinuclease ABC subunit A [Anaerococcus prevotii]
MTEIKIKGARTNNLKNVDINLPRDKMIVFTGLSGSGKSTLAFDTIYAEGQRRYVESLSSYARQFLGNVDKPDVDSIEGLSPSISIDQKTTNRNPRSTVATVTEIYDYYRLLYARVGDAYCPVCGRPIEAQSIDQMVDRVKELPERTRIQILAPVIRGKKGAHKRALENIQKDGYVRVVIDGEKYDLAEDIDLSKTKKHDISVVVDRIVIKDGIDARLTDSIETALGLADGLVIIDVIGEDEILLSSKLACPEGHVSLPEITPNMFSFNAPIGMCPDCNGLGFHLQVDRDLVIPDYDLSINEGAIDPYATSTKESYYYEMIRAIADHYKFSHDDPIKKAPKKMIEDILHGTNYDLSFVFDSHFSGRKRYTGPFEGAIKNIYDRYQRTGSDAQKKKFREYMSEEECDTCHGDRLKPEVLAIKVGGVNISELTRLSVEKSVDFFAKLELSPMKAKIADLIVKEIKARLSFLNDVGLTYLTLNRAAATLSGGESQRIRLATQIGSGLVGVCYVLDEPSIGLHQRDNDKLIAALRNLTDIGNTLIIVEHDEDTMKEADYIVDIGPKAGVHGGEIVAKGSLRDIMNSKKSITGDYLAGRKKIPVPKERRTSDEYIEIKGAAVNNLKNIDVKIPLGVLTTVTGVSGSGKSSLVNEILYKQATKKINKTKIRAGKHKEILGLDKIDKVIAIDQSPIGRTPRSNPATYTKVFDAIRDVFAMTNEAKMKGYDKGRFSFNVKGGRCEACKGDGTIKVDMMFLPDVYVPCEVCHGKRYNRETLEVKYKGKDISDVLDMTVEEGIEFFQNHPSIVRKLQTLYDVGLGYIKIGQPSTELSGGEAQRVKLATELAKVSTGKTLYILDEPTTGLHMADVHKLIEVLNRLVDQDNTVVVIEHNLDVIKVSDNLIDLGPEGGDGGGTLVASGTPEEIAKNKKSYTGQYLKKIL